MPFPAGTFAVGAGGSFMLTLPLKVAPAFRPQRGLETKWALANIVVLALKYGVIAQSKRYTGRLEDLRWPDSPSPVTEFKPVMAHRAVRRTPGCFWPAAGISRGF